MDAKFLYKLTWTLWWWHKFVEIYLGVCNTRCICIYRSAFVGVNNCTTRCTFYIIYKKKQQNICLQKNNSNTFSDRRKSREAEEKCPNIFASPLPGVQPTIKINSDLRLLCLQIFRLHIKQKRTVFCHYVGHISSVCCHCVGNISSVCCHYVGNISSVYCHYVGKYLIGLLSLCWQYLIGLLSLCWQYLIGLLSLCWQYLIGLLSLCWQYLTGLLSLCRWRITVRRCVISQKTAELICYLILI
jgi:hypothetical protein